MGVAFSLGALGTLEVFKAFKALSLALLEFLGMITVIRNYNKLQYQVLHDEKKKLSTRSLSIPEVFKLQPSIPHINSMMVAFLKALFSVTKNDVTLSLLNLVRSICGA